MKAPPAWQCYAQDFLTDVQEWDDVAVGIYFRFLNYQWINRDLPETPKGLSRLCNSDEETVNKYWNECIGEKFVRNENGRFYNKRLEDYWQQLMNHRKKCSKAGKKSAESRKKNDSS